LHGLFASMIIRVERSPTMPKTAMSKSRKRNNLIPYLVLAFVIALVGYVVVLQTRAPQSKLDEYRIQESELDSQLEVEYARTDELLLFEKEVQTTAYAEEQAQERLKLLKDNQIMFIAE